MPMHPEVEKIRELTKDFQLSDLSVEQLRTISNVPISPELQPAVGSVEDRHIPGSEGDIQIRIYTPLSAGRRPYPLLVYFHGGGWVSGNINTCDTQCRLIANQSEHLLISVDYRLAPENPYPAGLEDCYAVIRWASEHSDVLNVDRSRISVGGESAGGNLAAAVALMCRDLNGPRLSKQLLIVPAVDYYELGMESPYPSIDLHGTDNMLTKRDLDYYLKLYFTGKPDLNDPYAFPIRSDNLAGLPPALILTAEYDLLSDEGEAYGKKLRSFGIPVQIERAEGVLHAFLFMTEIDSVKEMYRQIGRFLLEE
ncbi:alpha/beta hydrolase [Bacillus sp. FJAT-28004]|uniref:alpha/beta hydrolase n=1 Tax=Bacillus sp. FJAT-28004 TaxID=1679165 RepID=UPI0006B4CE1F|nr:alpha/beta hydrolase [Bacillus sp. FJAT-28004]